MSKRIFTQSQIKELLQNPNVGRCSEKSITYCKEFKIKAIKQYHEGLPPSEIFRQAGFDINLIGHESLKSRLRAWRKIFKDKGVQGLSVDDRGTTKGKGRPKSSWKDDKEKIKYLEAEVDYLKAENDFLARLRKKS